MQIPQQLQIAALLLTGAFLANFHAEAPASHVLSIPFGKPVDIDGRVAAGEWDDAQFVEIRVRTDWRVRVGAKHDVKNIYFVFEGVKHGDERLFPEILIDPRNQKTATWEKGQWWLHVSNNLCEGDGEPNVYEKNGLFQCAHAKQGWKGNNPPGAETNIVEVSVAFAKLKALLLDGFGIAFDMTDAAGNEKQHWYFWPANAGLMSPRSWGTAVIMWNY